MPKLRSPNPWCRRRGCQATVPRHGGYPGMPQSHCCYCGMKTYYAASHCDDFVKPIYATWLDRLLMRLFP